MSFSDFSKRRILQHESFFALRLHRRCLNNYISASYEVKSINETSQDFTQTSYFIEHNYLIINGYPYSYYVLGRYRDFTLSCVKSV